MALSQVRYGCSAQIPGRAPPRRKEGPRANACTFTFIVTTVLSKLRWYEETFLSSRQNVPYLILGVFCVWQHLHPSTVEPRPYLSIEVKSENGAVFIAIPRSFRGQMMLHTDNGRVSLSSALATRAATLSTLNGTDSYFVGERPSSGKWHTGTDEDGEEVDGIMGSSKNGSVKVSYDDEDVVGKKGPGVLSTLFKAIGL
jgi:hypothetical protein